MLSDINFRGLIPAGTPLAQVIPFKRDIWKSYVGYDKKEIYKQERQLYSVFFDAYKKMFWDKKQYL